MAAIEKFNNANEKVDVLVTSFSVANYGMNLHKACQHGFIIQLPHNWNSIGQAIGRLTRLG